MIKKLDTHKALELVQNLYRAVDDRDTEALGKYLADDLVFQLGNLEAIEGKKAVLAANESFFQSIANMVHSIDRIWAQDNNVICSGSVEYTRLDNSKLSIPFSTILTLKDDLISHYQIYVDVSPL